MKRNGLRTLGLGVVLATVLLSGCVFPLDPGTPAPTPPAPLPEPAPVHARPVALMALEHAEPVAGESLKLDATASRAQEPGCYIKEYWWTIQGTGVQEGAVIVHTFEAPGTYRVELIVIDSDGYADTQVRHVIVTDPDTAPPSCGDGSTGSRPCG